MEKAKNPIKTVQTTIQILEKLKQLDGAGVTELAKELDITQGAVYNHLSTLSEHGFVVKKETKYYIGLRCCDFGEYAKHQQDVYEVMQPTVDALAEETGLVVTIMVEENGKGTLLYRVHQHSRLSPKTRVGSRVHLHCTALGKAILSRLPKEKVDSIIDNYGLPGLTPNTITEPEALYEELETINEQGVAFDDEESVENLRCVAAPIQTDEDDLLGSISALGLKGEIQGEYYRSELPNLVEDAATVIGINTTSAPHKRSRL